MVNIFLTFLALGFTAIGGPIAHIGYFQNAFVEKRRWLTPEVFSDLVALCHVLPGPASSQVGLGIGYMRGGVIGALAAWLGFTLPSALALTLLAIGLMSLPMDVMMHASRGLGWVVVVIVGHAVFQMSRNRVTHWIDSVPILIAFALSLSVQGFLGQLLVILMGGIWGLFQTQNPEAPSPPEEKKTFAWVWLAVWVGVLFALPLLSTLSDSIFLQVFDRFYRTGSLVFGGGHVVLPLLKAEWVDVGLVSRDVFVTGYGAAQAIPGPLFTISSYLGAVLHLEAPWLASIVALLAMFLPSILLVFGVLPYAERLRASSVISRILSGINLAVIGLLLAVWVNPVAIGALSSWQDAVGIAIAAGLFLTRKVPVPLLVGGLSLFTVAFPF